MTGTMTTTREWLRDGATVYTLKEYDGPRRTFRGPRMVNDLSFQVHGPDAEAVAIEVHEAITNYAALKARVAELEAREAARSAAMPCPWDLPDDERADIEKTEPCPVCKMLGTPDAEDKCLGGPRRSKGP